MNTNFQFKHILWNTFIILRLILLLFIILRFTCCSFLEIDFWIFWHFPLERRFLWIIGALRKVTTPLSSVHPQDCLCTQTPHWRQHNLGEVLFFFFLPITGNWGREVGRWGAWDCVWVLRMSWPWCNLEGYSFLIKLGLVLFSHRTRKQNKAKQNNSEWHLFQEL